MNSSFVVYLIILVLLFIMFIEYDKFKKFIFVVFLVGFLLFDVLRDYILWNVNFVSYDIWKISLIFVLILVFTFIINIIRDFRFEVMFLYLMVFFGSFVVVFCDNFVMIYLGLELQTFSLFILLSKNKSSVKGAESALKYFVLGSLSSGLFLLGITLIFSQGLTVNVKDLYIVYNTSNFLVKMSLVLISMSVFFKLALFPFHFWVPDIYEGSSLGVLAVISTIPKISLLSVILQILTDSSFFIISSVLSIIIGTIGAINQTKIKRLIAYSGISHMGFITLGMVLVSKTSCESSFVYLVIYVLSMVGIFFLIYKTIFTKNCFIIELGGLITINKIIGLSWLILILSIGGIPPLSGFLAKLVILNTLVDYNYLIVTSIVILFSAISVGYYLRMVKVIYFQKSSSYLNWETILKVRNHEKGNIINYLLGFVVYFNLIFVLHPSVIFTPFYLSFNYFF